MDSSFAGRSLIISSGRCGSTLLSDLIAEHAGTLSVQEYFMSVQPEAMVDDVLTGAEYWAILSSPKPDLSTLIRIGLPPKEIRYPSDGRWAGNLTELPRILAITLPSISSDPDGLYDVLASTVPEFPSQPAGRHHHMFLDLLTRLTGKRQWIERSGGSSAMSPYLLRTFRTGKIVYLTRNWADTALSMSRHSSFQLIQLRVEFLGLCGFDPYRTDPGPGQSVPPDLAHLLPDRLTAEGLLERGRETGRFLALCAFLESQTEQALADMPPHDLLRLRYEDLVADPAGELGRLGRFFEFDDWAEWASKVAHRVTATPRADRPALADVRVV